MTIYQAIAKLQYLAHNAILESGEKCLVLKKDDVMDILDEAKEGLNKKELLDDCPHWLSTEDFEFVRELYKESKIEAIKYLIPFAKPYVEKPLKECKELLDKCCK